jgi:phage-related tail fiber protein
MAKPSYLDPDVSTIYYDDETGEVVNELGAPTGTIAYFSLASAPDGWIKANGATISRTTYDKLFTAIGTTYGAGDGSTTFVLPDLRGEFIRSLDDGAGVDTGRGLGSSQAAANQQHGHYIGNGGFTVGSGYGAAQAALNISGTNNAVFSLYRYGRGSTYVYPTESDTLKAQYDGSEARPRNIAFLACIKY